MDQMENVSEIPAQEIAQDEASSAQKTITIPFSVAQELLNYLQIRPFQEVHLLIDKFVKTAR